MRLYAQAWDKYKVARATYGYHVDEELSKDVGDVLKASTITVVTKSLIYIIAGKQNKADKRKAVLKTMQDAKPFQAAMTDLYARLIAKATACLQLR